MTKLLKKPCVGAADRFWASPRTRRPRTDIGLADRVAVGIARMSMFYFSKLMATFLCSSRRKWWMCKAAAPNAVDPSSRAAEVAGVTGLEVSAGSERRQRQVSVDTICWVFVVPCGLCTAVRACSVLRRVRPVRLSTCSRRCGVGVTVTSSHRHRKMTPRHT